MTALSLATWCLAVEQQSCSRQAPAQLPKPTDRSDAESSTLRLRHRATGLDSISTAQSSVDTLVAHPQRRTFWISSGRGGGALALGWGVPRRVQHHVAFRSTQLGTAQGTGEPCPEARSRQTMSGDAPQGTGSGCFGREDDGRRATRCAGILATQSDTRMVFFNLAHVVRVMCRYPLRKHHSHCQVSWSRGPRGTWSNLR